MARCERRALCAAAVVVALVTGSAAAEPGVRAPAAPEQTDLFRSLALGSRKDPIRINSDALELDYKGSTLTYSGSVQVTQGDVTLTSDRLSITYDREAVRRGAPATPAGDGASAGPGGSERIKQVIAEGRVRIRKGDRLAEGKRAVFDQAKQTIVLSDGAVLHEGPNQVAGDRIVVYLQEERSVVEGGSNSRVTAVLYPGSESAGGEAAVHVGDASGGASQGGGH